MINREKSKKYMENIQGLFDEWKLSSFEERVLLMMLQDRLNARMLKEKNDRVADYQMGRQLDKLGLKDIFGGKKK